MSYDPDLDPILNALQAADAEQSARIAALEARPAVDLSGILDRLAKLEAAPVVTTPETPVPETPPVVAPPAVKQPIWKMVSQSKVAIPATITVPAGQREIIIPVVADHTDRESFYAYVSGYSNSTETVGRINVGNTAQQASMFKSYGVYTWSPGDDLTHFIRVTTNATYRAGQRFSVDITLKGLGDGQKGRRVSILFADDATLPEVTPQFHRPLRRLDLSKAKRANTFDPATVKWSDSGFGADGKPVWRARLSHGYSQVGNGETGAYLNEDAFPGIAQKPISYDAGERAIRLHTVAFPQKVEADGRLFPQQAAIIQGQTLDDVCGVEGVWRMVAKIPNRRYSWPAFWLAGRGSQGAKGGYTQWPPEIDILEKFNYAWGAADTPFTSTFGQHYGNAGSNSRIGNFGNEIDTRQWLGDAAPMDEAYHSWACAVVYNDDPRKAEVTYFVDDVEVGCQVLFARHQDMKTRLPFFPMVNVAVRAPGSYTPEQYNTDDGRGKSGDMLVRDVAYYPAGFTMPAGG